MRDLWDDTAGKALCCDSFLTCDIKQTEVDEYDQESTIWYLSAEAHQFRRLAYYCPTTYVPTYRCLLFRRFVLPAFHRETLQKFFPK